MRILLSQILLLFPLASVSAADASLPEPVRALQAEAQADDLAWRLLESLTTEVGPRMPGTPGDALGVAWAQRQLAGLGFDRIWKEPIVFPYWFRRAESARVVAPREQALTVTALGGSPSTGGVIAAEVVRFPDVEALAQADPATVAGKIAFIARRMERSQAGSGYGPAVAGRSRGPFVAAEKGALALVIRSIGTDNNRLAHSGMMSTSQPGVPVPAAALSNPDADILEGLLERGQPVTLELDLDCGFDGLATSYNVIAEYDGREADAGFVAVGGHLDSWDLGTGAVDDGAGVAITMAAAHLVARGDQRPRRGIRVVLFGNEEQGIHGGKAYARAHEGELAAHVIGAESDLGSGRVYQFRSRVLPAAEPELEVLAEWLKPLGIPWSKDREAWGGADFGQMRLLGMPVIDLNHDATEYFDLHHTANDTLDKVDASDLRFNVAAYATLIYWAAESTAVFGPLEATP